VFKNQTSWLNKHTHTHVLRQGQCQQPQ